MSYRMIDGLVAIGHSFYMADDVLYFQVTCGVGLNRFVRFVLVWYRGLGVGGVVVRLDVYFDGSSEQWAICVVPCSVVVNSTIVPAGTCAPPAVARNAQAIFSHTRTVPGRSICKNTGMMQQGVYRVQDSALYRKHCTKHRTILIHDRGFALYRQKSALY